MLAWLKPGRRRWVVSLVVLLGLLALLWQPFLLGVAAFMTVSSPVEKADFILLSTMTSIPSLRGSPTFIADSSLLAWSCTE